MNLQLKEPRVLLLPSRDARAGFISVGSEREETCPSQERLRFIAKRGGGGRVGRNEINKDQQSRDNAA